MASENPLQAYMEKKGGFGQALGSAAKATFSSQNIANHAVGAGAAALGAGAIAAVGGGVHMIYDAVTKARDFKNMLAENEDVAQMHAENPRAVNRMFSSLRTFAPEFTADPMVAGAYVRQMVDSPNGAPGFISGAIDSRRKLLGNKPSPHGFGEAMLAGASKGAPSNPFGPRQEALEEQDLGQQEHVQPLRHAYEREQAGQGNFGSAKRK